MNPFKPKQPLPVDAVLPALRAALQASSCAVLQAPPGAGKTTHVPLALLASPWLVGRRMVMLEPRRLAAHAAAHRMADLLGEPVGQTVGYRMRLDTRVSAATRIEVVTEGVLTRMLLDDPALEGVGLVLFDEFHERSLAADTGLAFCRQAQEVLRPDLRLLVMSATLDADVIARHLGGAPVLRSEGRRYPVETHYLGHPLRGHGLAARVAAAVRQALAAAAGDVLVFLPGAGEIRRTAALLDDGTLGPAVDVHPLYGNLPFEGQRRAIAPAPAGRRKVVLATSIAETSLTIEGVRIVVDAGLMRVPRFDLRSGLTRLATVPVTHDAADQRRGRAGRTAPGVCFRLWSQHEQQHLRPHRAPEITEADLASLALDLATWGEGDPSALTWLDPPPPAAFGQARDLLHRLEALGADGRITARGRRMAALPAHPRLAHMLLQAHHAGQGALAADLAALLDERDVLRRADPPPAPDIRLRLELLAAARSGNASSSHWQHHRVDGSALRRVRQTARMWRRRLGVPRTAAYDAADAGAVLALAYPDRVAQQAGRPGHFRLRDGRRAVVDEADPVAHQPFIVAAQLGGHAAEARVFLAAPLTAAILAETLPGQVAAADEVRWDRDQEAVLARRVRRMGTLILSEAPWPDPPVAAVAAVLLEQVAGRGLHVLPWTQAAIRLRERIAFLHHHQTGWPDVSDDALTETLSRWLGPHVSGCRRLEDLKRLDLAAVLRGLLGWAQQRDLDRLAPERLAVPSGSHIALDYSDPARPVLAVRLQEVFGLTDTPRVAGGQVPLTMHLLSPAYRPVQVTQDLANFWSETYFEVRKDLRGRYAKHHWPEDPTTAVATRRTRRR